MAALVSIGFGSPPRRPRPELLDQPQPPALVAGSLADLRRINRYLGGVSLTVRALAALLAERAFDEPLRVV